MADFNGNILVPPTFHYFDPYSLEHGLLKTWTGNLVAYYNRAGQLVWQEETVKQPYAFNIDYMQRGYFHASRANTGHPSSYGASPQEISMKRDFLPGTLSIIVRPNEETIIDDHLKAFRTYIANTTKDTLIFNAQDNRLYLKMQALNSKGEWQDIEYLPDSWCGNSYHAVALPGNHLWELSTIAYEGSIRTKLRLELTYVDPTDTVNIRESYSNSMVDWYYRDRRELKIYSNEFDGTINPGQFWRLREYYPNGIMDPYNE